MQVVLELKTGVLGGEKIYLAAGQSVTVGRSETARFPIPTDGQMSGLHFEVTCNERDCLLIDLNSTNGTRLNGETVGDSVLHDGDQITAGQSIFMVSIRSNDDIFDSAIDQVPAAASTFSPTPPEDDSQPEALDSVDSLPGTVHLTTDDGFDIRVIPGNCITVGRTERADFAITHDGHMSGVHFAVLNDGSQPRVRDENSTNGTRLNGAPVSDQELNDGDVIAAGRTEFRVTIKIDDLQTPKATPQSSATLGELPTAKILVGADADSGPHAASDPDVRQESTVGESSFVGQLDDLYADVAATPDDSNESPAGDSSVPSDPSERMVCDTPNDDGVENLTNEFPTQPIPIIDDDEVNETDEDDQPPEIATQEIEVPVSEGLSPANEVSSPTTDDPGLGEPSVLPPQVVESVVPPPQADEPNEPDEKATQEVEPTEPAVVEEEPIPAVIPQAEEKPSQAEPVCNTELKIVIVEYSTSGGESHQFWLTPNQLTIVGSGEDAHERIQSDAQIKARHFALSTDEKACRITDLESSGTLLNDNKIDSEYVLNDDVIRAGSTSFKIQVVGGIEQVQRFI